ncbi:hypothetical protein PIB30_084385 [Stylosanthes scabra]|uniref:Uncharacterized protein n=1 Tax=Stylosanthes scabra TaxID=79078 RepID=A0ABU6ZR56_9FABA|nr:hypothetical protein [Stylosanthes scabra]
MQIDIGKRVVETRELFAETAGNNEALLFDALNLNDEIQKVLKMYQEFNKPTDRATLAIFIPLQPDEPEEESAAQK